MRCEKRNGRSLTNLSLSLSLLHHRPPPLPPPHPSPLPDPLSSPPRPSSRPSLSLRLGQGALPVDRAAWACALLWVGCRSYLAKPLGHQRSWPGNTTHIPRTTTRRHTYRIPRLYGPQRHVVVVDPLPSAGLQHIAPSPPTDPALLLTTLRRYLAAGVVVRSRSETKSRQPLRTSPLACLTVLLLSGLLDTYAAAAGIRVLRNGTTRHDTTRHDETRHDTQHLSTPPTRRQDDRTHRRSELHVHGDCITHTPDPWQCRGALEAYCLLCTTKKVVWPRRLRCL